MILLEFINYEICAIEKYNNKFQISFLLFFYYKYDNSPFHLIIIFVINVNDYCLGSTQN